MGSRPSEFPLTPAAGSLRLYSTSELLRLPPPDWLIDHVLPEGGLAVLYGPPGLGKTFVALDLVLRVATGRDWFGHATVQGYPLYVSAEGGAGIGKRVGAWLDYHEVAPSAADVMWLLDAVPMYDGSSEVDRLLERIEEVDEVPSLIVIDTLARCFDGDENLQVDMNRFVGGVDKLRRKYKGTVLVVHHTRLDGDRERGNTALRGAADTMISLEGNPHEPQFTVKCAKQKDGADFESLDLQRVVVPERDSCVITTETGEVQSLIKNTLKNAKTPMNPRDLLKSLSQSHISRATLFRHLRETVENGEIIRENGEYRLA